MEKEAPFTSPLVSRYASPAMASIFSERNRYIAWRRLWVALAKGEMACGLPITQLQIDQLEESLPVIDLIAMRRYEARFRHDVMAQIHAYGDLCPLAKGIIHWGATSCYVTDNGDLLQVQEALTLILRRLVSVARELAILAREQATVACLAYTHLQPAQATTMGKRVTLWLQDILTDIEDLEFVKNSLCFLGIKGATGTQASFLTLFEGDGSRVDQLEQIVADLLNMDRIIPVSGQTYSRKQDIRISFVLSSLAASAHKFATDIRLLSHTEELCEGKAVEQVGSSAMPHKRNPMLSERLCGIARFLMSLHANSLHTESIQWLERSLDDSANRRLALPESFLCADALLRLYSQIVKNLQINPEQVGKKLAAYSLPLAAEAILMMAVKRGKNRQEAHEILRQALQGQGASDEKSQEHLLEMLAQSDLGLSAAELRGALHDAQTPGRAAEQTIAFIEDHVEPILKKHESLAMIDNDSVEL